MLAEWPAGTLESWLEYYRVEPFGDDWERSTAGPVEIVNAINSLAFGFGGGKGDPPKPLPCDALVPYRDCMAEERRKDREAVKQLEGLRGL